MRLEGLDVLASNAEEMKGCLKATLDRLDTPDLKEEGAGGKKEEIFSTSPKAAMSQRRVHANAACMLTQKNKRPAISTPCTVDMDVDAAEELSITKASEHKRRKENRLERNIRKLQKP